MSLTQLGQYLASQSQNQYQHALQNPNGNVMDYMYQPTTHRHDMYTSPNEQQTQPLITVIPRNGLTNQLPYDVIHTLVNVEVHIDVPGVLSSDIKIHWNNDGDPVVTAQRTIERVVTPRRHSSDPVHINVYKRPDGVFELTLPIHRQIVVGEAPRWKLENGVLTLLFARRQIQDQMQLDQLPQIYDQHVETNDV